MSTEGCLDGKELNRPRRQCPLCQKNYSQYSNLYRHIRDRHKSEQGYKRPCGLRCPSCECSVKIRGYEKLRKHIASVHGIVVERQKIRFPAETDFLEWKRNTEIEMRCYYVLCSRGARSLATGEMHTYYRCFRSGIFKEKAKGGKRKRNLKYMGSVKMNGHCPSAMEVRKSNARVKVTFYTTHFGHDFDIKYLPPKIRMKAENVAWYTLLHGTPFAYCKICDRKFKSHQKSIEGHQRTQIHIKNLQVNSWILEDLIQTTANSSDSHPNRFDYPCSTKNSIDATIQKIVDDSKNDAYSSSDDKSVSSSVRNEYLDFTGEDSLESPNVFCNNSNDNLVRNTRDDQNSNSDANLQESEEVQDNEELSSDELTTLPQNFSSMLKQLESMTQNEEFSVHTYAEANKHLQQCIDIFQSVLESRNSSGLRQQEIQLINCASEVEVEVENVHERNGKAIESASHGEVQTITQALQQDVVQTISYAPEQGEHTMVYVPHQGLQTVTYIPQSQPVKLPTLLTKKVYLLVNNRDISSKPFYIAP